MIEKIVRDYLEGVLSVPVYMELPPKLPERFVIVEKLSSAREEHINSSMFALKSYAGSLYEAAVLNASVIEAMDALDTTDAVSGIRKNNDYPFPDTSTKRYRYQAVFDIYHY